MGFAEGPLPQKAPSTHKEDKKLMETCKEFEAVLLTNLFKQMRGTVEEEDMFGNTRDREMFNSMLDEERAKAWSQSGGIGLATVMYEQMKRNNP